MKKYISLTLIILLVLTGCGKKENKPNNTNDTPKFEVKEDSYYFYQNESIKKEIFLSKDGVVVIANCEYLCELEKGTYTIKDNLKLYNSIKIKNNKLSTETKKYDNSMCESSNDSINREYELKEDYLVLNKESYTIVDKTEASDVDYYKDIKCNKRQDRNTVTPALPREN